MSRTGKCTNYSGCLLAYRGEETSVAEGQPFVCAECGKPLSEVKGSSSRLILFAVGGVVLVGVLAGLAIAVPRMLAGKKEQPAAATPEPAVSPAPPPQEVTDAPAPPPANPNKVGDAEPPPVVKVEPQIKMAVDPRVKEEVLKRIDAVPNLTPTEKDRLYASVDKAKQMGLVITVPFGKGESTLSQGDALALKEALEQPAIAKLRTNPFAVFVVLGYADPKGSVEANLRTSRDRANAVVNAIHKDFGDRILVRAVGMGGTTLLDAQNLEKNRIAEVWVVLP